jgi:hypothetical protein
MRSIEAGDPARPRQCAPVNDQVVVEHTRRWISSFVIGLGLCPFARRVFDAAKPPLGPVPLIVQCSAGLAHIQHEQTGWFQCHLAVSSSG